MKSVEKPPVETTKSLVETPRAWPSPEEGSSDQIVASRTFAES